MRQSVCTLACLIAISTVSVAQDCAAIFKYGIYDYNSSEGGSMQASSFANWFCSHHSDEQSMGEHYGASYSDFVRKITGNVDKDQQDKKVDDLCRNDQGMQSIQTAFKQSSQTINEAILGAYKACLSAKGLLVWLETTSVPTKVRFAANFISDSETELIAHITSFSYNKGVTCHGPTPTDKITGSTRRYDCTRKSKTTPISIILNATRDPIGGSDLDLPGLPGDIKCASSCSTGCNNYDGKPVCAELKCTKENMDYGQLSENQSGEVIRCNLPRGHYYVTGKAGVGPRGTITVTPDWYATVEMELDDGSGNWRRGDIARRPSNADNTDHGEISFNGEGEAAGDGPVRIRFTLLNCRLGGDAKEPLAIGFTNLTIATGK